MTLHRHLTVRLVLAGSLALAAPLALSGCSLIGDAVGGGVENVTEGVIEGATGGEIDLPGTTIPDDFPAEVPLLNEDVVSGVAFGDGASKVWNVSIAVSDQSAFDQISTQLTDAGFENSGFMGETDQGSSGAFSKGDLAVLVVVSGDASGLTANYTVSRGAPQ
jgi:hypothetical protein